MALNLIKHLSNKGVNYILDFTFAVQNMKTTKERKQFARNAYSSFEEYGLCADSLIGCSTCGFENGKYFGMAWMQNMGAMDGIVVVP